ncbi:hypothetical protein LCGC14_2966910 [marine sediment metagenome]|uniref:HTH marR-type domain-containing protein n=1 Tax=marine sediment metagenome TaxID=412755 RepID=A0A0F8XAJ1_9ZZZZ
MITQKTYPQCAYCKREFQPGTTWSGANYCRAAHLLAYLEEYPGSTTWEMAKATGMPYAAAQKAVLKARDWDLVAHVAEERGAGGERFRYTVVEGYQAVIAGWTQRGLV